MWGACSLWLSAPRPTALHQAPLCPVPVPGEALGVQRGRQKPVVRRNLAPATPSHSAPLAVRSPTLRPPLPHPLAKRSPYDGKREEWWSATETRTRLAGMRTLSDRGRACGWSSSTMVRCSGGEVPSIVPTIVCTKSPPPPPTSPPLPTPPPTPQRRFPSAKRPPRFCHGRQLTSQNARNRIPPPPPRTASKNLRGRELGPSPMRPGP